MGALCPSKAPTTGFVVEIPPRSAPVQQTHTDSQELQAVIQDAAILLPDLVPVLKTLTTNKDEMSYIDCILTTFLRKCSHLAENDADKLPAEDIVILIRSRT
jgi:hypothetical protein